MLLTVVLEKTLGSPLDCKVIQPVHCKGNQSWIFIRRTDTEAEIPILLTTWCEELTHWKRPWCWERLKVGGEGDDRGWDGWMASLTQWTQVWVSSSSWWRTGSLACCSSWGCKESDTTEWLNRTKMPNKCIIRTQVPWFVFPYVFSPMSLFHWKNNRTVNKVYKTTSDR